MQKNNFQCSLDQVAGDHFALTILPAVLKSHFDGTNVAMTPRYLRTTIARSV